MTRDGRQPDVVVVTPFHKSLRQQGISSPSIITCRLYPNVQQLHQHNQQQLQAPAEKPPPSPPPRPQQQEKEQQPLPPYRPNDSNTHPHHRRILLPTKQQHSKSLWVRRVWMKMIHKKGFPTARECTFPHDCAIPDDFFVPYTTIPGESSSTSMYTLELLTAVRHGRVDVLERLVASSSSSSQLLHARNRYGQSLWHVACRCQQWNVVQLLVARGVPVQVRDVDGRTPLHDCFWTTMPPPSHSHTTTIIVQIILQQCPDLLYLQDARGHTPLAYIRPEHVLPWLQYLAKHIEYTFPQKLLFLNEEKDNVENKKKKITR